MLLLVDLLRVHCLVVPHQSPQSRLWLGKRSGHYRQHPIALHNILFQIVTHRHLAVTWRNRPPHLVIPFQATWNFQQALPGLHLRRGTLKSSQRLMVMLQETFETLLKWVIPVILCNSVLNNFIIWGLSYIIFWWVRELQKISPWAWVMARMTVRVYFLSRGATPRPLPPSSRSTFRCPLPSRRIRFSVLSVSSLRSTGTVNSTLPLSFWVPNW